MDYFSCLRWSLNIYVGTVVFLSVGCSLQEIGFRIICTQFLDFDYKTLYLRLGLHIIVEKSVLSLINEILYLNNMTII